MHEEKYKKEIEEKLEFLCPNVKDLKFDSSQEEESFSKIQTAMAYYRDMHVVLIKEEFKNHGWSPIPEQKEDLIYLAALNSTIDLVK